MIKTLETLKKNSEFQNVYQNGKSLANKYLVMYILGNSLEKNRIGISVSKKVGNSVVRHRLTRLIKEIFRLNTDNLEKKLDIVIIVRVNAKGKTYKELESAFLHLTKMHRILKEMV